MTSNALVLLEFLLVAALVLGLAVFELRSVTRRDDKRPPEPGAGPEEERSEKKPPENGST